MRWRRHRLARVLFARHANLFLASAGPTRASFQLLHFERYSTVTGSDPLTVRSVLCAASWSGRLLPMQGAMSGTTAGSVPTPDGPQGQALRERATLIGFVIVAVVATFAWLGLLGWLAIEGLQALGV